MFISSHYLLSKKLLPQILDCDAGSALNLRGMWEGGCVLKIDGLQYKTFIHFFTVKTYYNMLKNTN